MDNTDTIGILKQLERGEISAAEADARLERPTVVEQDYEPPYQETDLRRWVRKLWIYPLIGGLTFIAFGVWIIVSTVHANILWFLLGLPILLIGTAIVAIASSAESGHWLYVNVKSARKGRGVRFGIPFSLGLFRLGLWLARLFGWSDPLHFSVNGRTFRMNAAYKDADEFLSALESELRHQRGLTIDVDDQDERVQVYIV